MSSRNKIYQYGNVTLDNKAPYFDMYSPTGDPIKKKTTKKVSKKKTKSKDVKKPKTQNIDKDRQKKKYVLCKEYITRLPSPIDTTVVNKKIQSQCPIITNPLVVPRKLSGCSETPNIPTENDLMVREPVILNSQKKQTPYHSPISSFDFVYNPKYRQAHPSFEMYMKKSEIIEKQLSEILEFIQADEDDVDDYEEDYSDRLDEFSLEEISEENSSQLTLVSTMKGPAKTILSSTSSISQAVAKTVSAATSIDPGYQIDYDKLYIVSDELLTRSSSAANVMTDMLDKYHGSFEVCTRPPVKRKLFDSETSLGSYRKPDKSYFGVKSGSMNMGDESFSPGSRNKQSLPIAVCAFVYSILKKPIRWNADDIDRVLKLGDELYHISINETHLHHFEILTSSQLYEVIEVNGKTIRYNIEEPDVTGQTRSIDSKVLDLYKGLVVFFKRNKAGILQTRSLNYLILKQKHYFVFDPSPRNPDLDISPSGVAVLVNVYDLKSVVVMLEKGGLNDEPFMISKISLKLDEPDESPRVEDEYFVVNPDKAVVCAFYDLQDPCFEHSRNKQALAMSLIAIVYSNLSQACGWTKRTLNKIMLIGNQLYSELCRTHGVDEIYLDLLPGCFMLGPISVELKIFANQFAGLMFKKSECLIAKMIDKMFQKCSKAILEIDTYALGVWKDGNMYYMFDPYSRNEQGLSVVNGTACVSMNNTLASLVETLLYNFTNRDAVFKIHVMKILRITKDFRTDSDDVITEHDEFKPVQVDATEKAIQIDTADAYKKISVVHVSSDVRSLDDKFVPVLHNVCCPPSTPDEIVCNLDSQSLSDTQIDKERPNPEDVFIKYLHDPVLEEQEAEDMELEDIMVDKVMQTGREKFATKEQNVNTDETGLFPPTRVVMEPDEIGEFSPIVWPEEDLVQPHVPHDSKSTNFVTLPDGSQILYGTTNIALIHKDYELLSPFVSMMAVVTKKKYSLHTWSTEVVDFVMNLGKEVYSVADINFFKVSKIELQKVSIGTSDYKVVSKYMLDNVLQSSTLEHILSRLFMKEDTGIVSTCHYSCAVFFNNDFYYMYDSFGCGLVGMGEGPSNTGVACLFRFKSISELVKRVLFNKKCREDLEPKETSRFIVATVLVQSLHELPQQSVLEIKKPKNSIGYKRYESHFVIEGTKGLEVTKTNDGVTKECHFICICAMLCLFNNAISKWDTRRVDYVVDQGLVLFDCVDDLELAAKRSIKNLMIDQYIFDIVVKNIQVLTAIKSKGKIETLKYLLSKTKYLIIQSDRCYLIYMSKNYVHFFTPYGIDNSHACWVRFENLEKLLSFLKSPDYYYFTINVCILKKAPKRAQLCSKLEISRKKKKLKAKSEVLVDEKEEWLAVFPLPWSRMQKVLASGSPRGSNRWMNWDMEIPNDLYSLVGTKNQNDLSFPEDLRGKQTIGNCVVCIIMTCIYRFSEWNATVMDSILNHGYNYFVESMEVIKEDNEELDEVRMTDFLFQVSVFPYDVIIDHYPVVNGTMFTDSRDKFNLSKALNYFFHNTEYRNGIIVCAKHGRCLAFGKISPLEYYMYDCQTFGPPMFVDNFHSVSYILRCHSLNRLLHLLTVSLRGGEFFVYHVSVEDTTIDERIAQGDQKYDETIENNVENEKIEELRAAKGIVNVAEPEKKENKPEIDETIEHVDETIEHVDEPKDNEEQSEVREE